MMSQGRIVGLLLTSTRGVSSSAESGLILLAALWLGSAVLSGWLADFKGRRFIPYAVAGLIVGPVAVVIVLFIPRPREVREAEEAAQRPGELPPRWKKYIGLTRETSAEEKPKRSGYIFFAWGVAALLGAILASERHETELTIVSIVAGLTMIGVGMHFTRKM